MKKFSLYSLLMFLSLLTASNVYAYDVEVDGIYYNLDMNNYTASVTSGDNKYTGDVVIPSSITYNTVKFNVVMIEKYAFSACNGLTSVNISDGIEEIGSDAFQGCSELLVATIPNTVKTIGSGAFYRCTKLEKADLPEGIELIGSATFRDCYQLAEINIPTTVKRINSEAFRSCQSVKKLFIPKAVNYIETSAFEGLTLEELVVEDGDEEVTVESWPFHSTSTQTIYMGRPLPLNSKFNKDETKTLILGPNLNKWYDSYTGTGITKVVSKIADPSQLAPTFDNITYLNAKLIVPKGTLELYKADENWKKFINISEDDSETGIDTPKTMVNGENLQSFSLKGIRINGNSKGISIVRENGKTKKIVK